MRHGLEEIVLLMFVKELTETVPVHYGELALALCLGALWSDDDGLVI